MRIRHARAEDAADLSALALRSKAHWGYDAAFLAACRDELTVTAGQCVDEELFVAETEDGELAGFSHVTGTGTSGTLESLFVEPRFIGRGVGGRLLRHALSRASAAGMTTLTLDADPHAVPFYEHGGARIVGTAPSGSIPGRELPRMAFIIQEVV